MAAPKRTTTPLVQTAVARLHALIGPELHEFIEQSLGRERSELEAAIRQRIIEDAQEIFIEYAKTELMIALGLSRRADPWTDGEAE